jgi:hypothetical protein
MALATLTVAALAACPARLPGFVPVREQHAWLLGTRDLDPAEEEMLLDSQSGECRPSRSARTGERVRKELDGPQQIHVHLDLDVLDPSDGRGERVCVRRWGVGCESSVRDARIGLTRYRRCADTVGIRPELRRRWPSARCGVRVLESFFGQSED